MVPLGHHHLTVVYHADSKTQCVLGICVKGLTWEIMFTELKVFVFDCDDFGIPDAGTRRTFLAFEGDEGEPDVCHSPHVKCVQCAHCTLPLNSMIPLPTSKF